MIFFLLFILSLRTTIQPKARFLINLFFLFLHGHSTKVGGHSNSLIYSFLNSANISFAVLPLYFVRYIRTLIFPALYLCCSYISCTISMAIWSLSQKSALCDMQIYPFCGLRQHLRLPFPTGCIGKEIVNKTSGNTGFLKKEVNKIS